MQLVVTKWTNIYLSSICFVCTVCHGRQYILTREKVHIFQVHVAKIFRSAQTGIVHHDGLVVKVLDLKSSGQKSKCYTEFCYFEF